MTLDERPHALYRFFGAGGTLLYIGITVDLPARLTDHRDDKAWWLGVTTVTVEHYPDRASVLEAERRAIVAERPLYNAQHNGSPIRVEVRPKAAGRVRELIPICVTCKKEIPWGDKGVIHVLTELAFLRLEALEAEDDRDRAERAAEPSGLRIISLAELSRRYDAMPPSASWSVHCDACNPHFDEDSRTWCNGCYWFSVDRCRTWADLIEWTCHMSEKNWLRATNWMDFIRAISHGTNKVGLVNTGRGAVA